MSAYAALQNSRYRVDLAPQSIHDEPQLYTAPRTAAPEMGGYLALQRNRYQPQMATAPILHQVQLHPVPPVSQPDLSYLNLQRNRFQVAAPPQIHLGATVQQQFIFPVSQPEPARVSARLQSSRFLVEAPKRVDGATVQATFIFPPNQPEPTRVGALLQSPRFLVEAPKRFDGAAAQATFIFPPNQPEPQRANALIQGSRFLVEAIKRFDGSTVQDFATNQPEVTYFRAAQRNRYLVDAPRMVDQIQSTGPPQTYIMPVSGPQFAYYVSRIANWPAPPAEWLGMPPAISLTRAFLIGAESRREVPASEQRAFIVMPDGRVFVVIL